MNRFEMTAVAAVVGQASSMCSRGSEMIVGEGCEEETEIVHLL
jgi:hypothetical protein